MPKIILLGAGGVGTAFLEMLYSTKLGEKILKRYSSIHVFDMEDKSEDPTFLQMRNVKPIFFTKIHLRKDNINLLLNKIKEKDLVVDLSYNIHYEPIVKKCAIIKANYINTSLERWPLFTENNLDSEFTERTLQYNHNLAKKIEAKESTILLTHGMNPGLITHFVFLGLEIVAKKVLDYATQSGINNTFSNEIRDAYKTKDFPKLAFLLELKVIHCSENDTQKPSKQRNTENEFINTWGPYSFYSEGVDPVQLGWGTHEKDFGISSDNQIFLKTRGIDLYAESHTYNKKIIGMLISHSENDTLSSKLTYKHDSKIYRPSVYYVYSPCDLAWDSIDKVKKNMYDMLPYKKLLRGHEIGSGEDAVGALLIFETDPCLKLKGKKTPPVSFWSGTILDIKQTRSMNFLYSGPTVIQVGASLLSAINYIDTHEKLGVVFPEDLPYDEILKEAIPFLGKIFTDYVPYYVKSTQFHNFVRLKK